MVGWLWHWFWLRFGTLVVQFLVWCNSDQECCTSRFGLVLCLLCFSNFCNFWNVTTKTGLMLILSYLLGIIDNDVDLIAVFIPSRASSPFMMADFIPSWIGWFPCFSCAFGFFWTNRFIKAIYRASLGGCLDSSGLIFLALLRADKFPRSIILSRELTNFPDPSFLGPPCQASS